MKKLVVVLVDDSEKCRSYYKDQFQNYNDKSILNLLNEIFDHWQIIVKANKIRDDQKDFLVSCLRHTNKFVWHEAGSRLVKCIAFNPSIKDSFSDLMEDTKYHVRFNVTALLQSFDNKLQKEILEKAICDKSQKVRIKAADVILQIQRVEYLDLLKHQLQVEEKPKVVEAIKFTLKFFNRINLRENGSTVLEMYFPKR